MEGRILAARHKGAYALRLVGDVRVNLCAAIEKYLEQMFEDRDLRSVTLDLCEAEGIDSTTLGILAKLALRAQRQCGFKPAIYSSNAGINRLLRSMAFGRLFTIRERALAEPERALELPAVATDSEQLRGRVIEAHRVLMDLSEDNRARFQDLMEVLEQP